MVENRRQTETYEASHIFYMGEGGTFKIWYRIADRKEDDYVQWKLEGTKRCGGGSPEDLYKSIPLAFPEWAKEICEMIEEASPESRRDRGIAPVEPHHWRQIQEGYERDYAKQQAEERA